MTKTLTLLKTRFEGTGGAEKYARVLAQAFYDKGYGVTVLTTGTITKPYSYEVHTHRLRSRLSVSKLWEFEGVCEKHLRRFPTDIVLSLDRNRFQTHLRASFGVHKAYLNHRKHFDPPLKRLGHILNPLHSSLLHIEKMGFEHPELQVIFTNSNLVKNEIRDLCVVDPDKIHVVHNGVQWKAFERPFGEIRYNNDRYELLFIGSGFERKGLRPLLKTLKYLRSDVHLTVVGGDKQLTSYRSRYKDQVSFVGPQDSVLPYLQKADCLLIPSYYDPFANVTVEALAMGLTVVSSKTNGGCEVLTPETGIIIENISSQESLIAALELAIQRPKTPTRAKMIRESVQDLDFSRQLNRYIALC
jgi:UDP-glucose:(heptosyl)LPS alpha-1,3-glucosyltransferase